MLLNVSVGLNPSAATSLVSLSICCLIPATRISKNSSRFELKMQRNFTRSISGWVGSCASSRTRRLNSSQLSSRLMKFFGSPKRSWAVCSAATGTMTPSSVSTLDCACAIFARSTNQPRMTRREALSRSGYGLVSNVFGRGCVNRVLCDVGSVIPDALEATRDKNQIEIAPELLRVLGHAVGQAAVRHFVHVVEILVPGHDRAAKVDIFPGKSVDAVFEHRHGVSLDRNNDFDFWKRWMPIQFSRAASNVRGLVGNALDIGRKFHRSDDPTQIRRHRLEPQQHVDAVLVDLLFQLVDLFVVGDCGGAKIIVSLQQSLDRAVEGALGQARHHQHVVAQ